MYKHRTDGRWSTSAGFIESRRLPALLHVQRTPPVPAQYCQHPMSVRQPVCRDAAGVHLLGTYPAQFRNSLTDAYV